MAKFAVFRFRFLVGRILSAMLLLVTSSEDPLTSEDRWNLPDSRAVVGKLFRYRVASNEPCSDFYKIVERGGTELPTWIVTGSDSRCDRSHVTGSRDELVDGECGSLWLEGVARPSQAGSHHDLVIQLATRSNDGQCVPVADQQDSFSIDIVPDTISFEGSMAVPYGGNDVTGDAIQPVSCEVRSSLTRASVVVGTYWSDLISGQRVAILRRFAEHLQLPLSAISLLPVENTIEVDETILVTGPSDVTGPVHNGGILLRWNVGCGNVQAPYMAVLERLEQTAKDGRMSRDLLFPVVGWRVTNRAGRMKRSYVVHVRPTATPLPVTPTRPTGSPVSPITPSSAIPSVGTTEVHPTKVVTVPMATTSSGPTDTVQTEPTEPEWVSESLQPSSPGITGAPVREKTTPLPSGRVSKPPSATTTTSGASSTSGRLQLSNSWLTVASSVLALTVVTIPTVDRTTKRPSEDEQSSTADRQREDGSGGSSLTSQDPGDDPRTWVTGATQGAVPEGSSETAEDSWTTNWKDKFRADPATDLIVVDSTTVLPPRRTVPRSDQSLPLTRDTTPSTSPASHTVTPPRETTTTRKPREKWRKRTRRPKHRLRKTTRAPRINYAPVVQRQLGRIDVDVGDILLHHILNDTFFDYEDGGAWTLKLILTDNNHMTLDPNSWIKLNATSPPSLYGLPLDDQAGLHNFQLSAINRHDKMTSTPLQVLVKRRSRDTPVSHEFSLVLDTDFRPFKLAVEKRIEVASKIARAFGDQHPTFVRITRLTPGSVTFCWTNSSLIPADDRYRCPVSEITALTQQVLSENGSIVDRFATALHPYHILAASVIPLGPCQFRFTAVTSSDHDGEITPSKSGKNGEVARGILYVAISLAVLTVVLVVVFAACTARRRPKKGSAAVTAAAAVGKSGIPVIFVDELDGDRAGAGGAGAAVDTDDDEPIAAMPPEYRPATSTSPAAGGDYKLLLVESSASSDDNDNDDDEVELSRFRQTSDSIQRRQDTDPSLQQPVQSSYSGPPLKPPPSYVMPYCPRR